MFNTNKIDEEIIMDMMIDALELLTIKQMMSFILSILLVQTILLWSEKKEDKKLIQKARNIFTNLKTDPNSVLFSEEKIGKQLFKNLKYQNMLKALCS